MKSRKSKSVFICFSLLLAILCMSSGVASAVPKPQPSFQTKSVSESKTQKTKANSTSKPKSVKPRIGLENKSPSGNKIRRHGTQSKTPTQSMTLPPVKDAKRKVRHSSNRMATKTLAWGIGAFFYAFLLVGFGLLVLSILSGIFIFRKAGLEWWEALVPIYNIYKTHLLCEMPIWSFVLLIIPYVNGLYGIWIIFNLAKVFDKSPLYALGLLFAPVIFFPHLAFGSSVYRGSGGGPGPGPASNQYRMVA